MSQEIGHAALQERTQQLLNGPLKHIRAAALAAALLPLASVAVAPASAQDSCGGSGGVVCGVVFNDTNNNGIQDVDETGIEGVKVFVCEVVCDENSIQVETGPDGYFEAFVPQGPTTIAVQIPTGTQASPPDVGNDTFDSDGTPDGTGFSVTHVETIGSTSDFGFFTPPVEQPGTGTPGYWKNHPEAWPVQNITVGGVSYTKAQAITWLGRVGKDKTTTMFSSLVPAILNLKIGNDGSCVERAIADAHKWMAPAPAGYGPVGSNVAGSSYAWSVGEPLHQQMDNYNNGRLCAPHRN